MAAPPDGRFIVGVIPYEDETTEFARVICRAPGPERNPVADLTAVLCGWHDRFQPKELAEFLHKHGVRVVTDDE